MKVYTKKEEIAKVTLALKQDNASVGMVPTMGALHEGHLQLVIKALETNNVVVVSIFVNPTQFDNVEDLEKYPRTLEQDIKLLETVSTSRISVYAPSVEDIYEGNTTSETFDFDGLEFEMEGKFRQGHFDGVGTIVKRLLDIVKPNHAYFGEKDFQQLQIVKKLVEKHAMPVTVVGCSIHREASGLAMSSRNTRLTAAHKKEAPFIYKVLKTAKSKFGTESAIEVLEWVDNQFKANALLELEYFLIADVATLKPIEQKLHNKKYRAFIAVYAGDIRLIDNIALN